MNSEGGESLWANHGRRGGPRLERSVFVCVGRPLSSSSDRIFRTTSSSVPMDATYALTTTRCSSSHDMFALVVGHGQRATERIMTTRLAIVLRDHLPCQTVRFYFVLFYFVFIFSLSLCTYGSPSSNMTSPDTPNQLANRARNAPLLRYVDSLRQHGHRAALIDPLNKLEREEVAALDPARYGLTDPEKEYEIDGIIWNSDADDKTRPASSNQRWSLEKITKHLREVYVGPIAYEFMHSPSKSERLWFAHLLESEPAIQPMSNERRKRIYAGLAKSEIFDTFLQDKFPNLKRYGLEGAEGMIPALETLFDASSKGTSLCPSAFFFSFFLFFPSSLD